MYTLYGNEASVHSLLQNLNEDKKIVFKHILYRFYIVSDVLYIDIIRSNTSETERTIKVESNIKPDYGLYVEDASRIHIVVSTRKYELKHIVFDGSTLKSETIYYYHNTVGIPSNPIIVACKSYVMVAVMFIYLGKQKAWSLSSFTKNSKDWVQRIIDKGNGLCYTQHDVCNVGDHIHLVYKHYDEDKRLNLKYSFYTCSKMCWHKPQIIYDNGKDKYLPKVFVNEHDKLFFLWLELEDEVFLSVANSIYETDYARIRITNFADSVLLYNTKNHIYAVSSKKRRLFYDLCCNIRVGDDAKELIKRSNFEMDRRIKLLLDIKKEYDDSIHNMRKDMSRAMQSNSGEIKFLKAENQRLLKEIEDRNKRIVELEDLNESLVQQAVQEDVKNHGDTSNEGQSDLILESMTELEFSIDRDIHDDYIAPIELSENEGIDKEAEEEHSEYCEAETEYENTIVEEDADDGSISVNIDVESETPDNCNAGKDEENKGKRSFKSTKTKLLNKTKRLGTRLFKKNK